MGIGKCLHQNSDARGHLDTLVSLDLWLPYLLSGRMVVGQEGRGLKMRLTVGSVAVASFLVHVEFAARRYGRGSHFSDGFGASPQHCDMHRKMCAVPLVLALFDDYTFALENFRWIFVLVMASADALGV